MLQLLLLIVFSFQILTNPTSSSIREENKSEDIISLERKGSLNSSRSSIGTVEFWEKEPVDSWYIACNYLSFLKEKIQFSSFPKDAALKRCIAAAYQRINYRLPDSKDPEQQATYIREFEPLVAQAVDRKLLTLDLFWLNEMPEIAPEFDHDKGVMRILYTTDVPGKILRRFPSSFVGNILWVGGERDHNTPHEDKYIVNVDKDTNPDMLADASNAYHLMVFPNNKFQKIEFDHIGHTILTATMIGDVLRECHRILQKGGTLEFRTEHGPKDYYGTLIKNNLLTTIKARLGQTGFNFKDDKVSLRKDESEEWTSNPYYVQVEAIKP